MRPAALNVLGIRLVFGDVTALLALEVDIILHVSVEYVVRLFFVLHDQSYSGEFLNGVRNVLKRENVVEAISICEATPGPVARLVKIAILNRESGRDGVREALEESGLLEVPRLEDKLNLLATIAQIAPIMGLLGTVLGFMRVFSDIQAQGLNAHSPSLA